MPDAVVSGCRMTERDARSHAQGGRIYPPVRWRGRWPGLLLHRHPPDAPQGACAMRENDAYRRARARVEELKGFYVHLLVFLTVNAGLLAINLLTNRDNLWFYWPLVAWGIGLAIHALAIYGFEGVLGRDWEERKTAELMRREEDRGQGPHTAAHV
jgi:hypothetical protein